MHIAIRCRFAIAILLALAAPAAAEPSAKLPVWPAPTLAAGEREGTSFIYGVTQRWLSKDGVPVAFHHVVRADGRAVLRAFWPTGRQDVLVHAFGDDELVVIHHDDGEVGFQFHRYITGRPDAYLGVRARWTGSGFQITRKKAFHGNQTAPEWLYDPAHVAPPLVAWRTMATGARSGDASAFARYFDDAPVTITRRGTFDARAHGAVLASALVVRGMPLMGYLAKCDRQGCCTADTAALGAWDHIAKICFSRGLEPRVRAIDLVSP